MQQPRHGDEGRLLRLHFVRALHTLQAAFTAADGRWPTRIIWAKDAAPTTSGSTQDASILYDWPQGIEHDWCSARDQGDVWFFWFFDQPVRNDLHPTMQPVALIERAIGSVSKRRDIELEPFGRLASTLIAAGKTGRQARLVELDNAFTRLPALSGTSAATLESDIVWLDPASGSVPCYLVAGPASIDTID